MSDENFSQGMSPVKLSCDAFTLAEDQAQVSLVSTILPCSASESMTEPEPPLAITNILTAGPSCPKNCIPGEAAGSYNTLGNGYESENHG